MDTVATASQTAVPVLYLDDRPKLIDRASKRAADDDVRVRDVGSDAYKQGADDQLEDLGHLRLSRGGA